MTRKCVQKMHIGDSTNCNFSSPRLVVKWEFRLIVFVISVPAIGGTRAMSQGQPAMCYRLRLRHADIVATSSLSTDNQTEISLDCTKVLSRCDLVTTRVSITITSLSKVFIKSYQKFYLYQTTSIWSIYQARSWVVICNQPAIWSLIWSLSHLKLLGRDGGRVVLFSAWS